ncbi:uncharacterized protein BDZ99DRAFT_515945 [Mytilinidion resinicola]|uniref:GPI mannosyltransferase 1 n=1 Tax=Mytilinidion resinicola TaxID=574789 RepID=A0A6A6Z4J3_9PEZI|nr:uncharacterized protein BDZ99DRAFT_515945 [Mytilinidion resinicola]KAF2815204.1 hypothetical protein BDZ99DRAFT_515945 [Mytilinidion resinicola]
MVQFFSSVGTVFSAAIALRVVLLIYGSFQDAFSPMKYTDIDYFVFTDAARFISRGRSPYARDTYRYTPLLAWFIYPTTWQGSWFLFGKILFALGDIAAGWLILLILRSSGKMPLDRALKFASIWLLNPMVAQISTRGSSEGLLGVIVSALLWSVLAGRMGLAGCLLGFAVHFKIYPFIYATSIIWWLDDEHCPPKSDKNFRRPKTIYEQVVSFTNPSRVTIAVFSLLTFTILNGAMYYAYGWPFLQHSYFHHLTRIDHRHNFSPYNTLLYLNSSPTGNASIKLESWAFVPQLFLSTVAIPLALAKKDLPSTMLAQTFAFVTFNKVCTSQYFLWYIMFLPFYLPTSTLLQKPATGIVAGVLWVFWLHQGYRLEFLGISSFVPGLWASSVFFFLVNIWILGIIITDLGRTSKSQTKLAGNKKNI